MSSPPSTELTTTLDVLAEPRRRYLLATLLEREQPAATDASSASEQVPLETLVSAVARLEQDTTDVADEQRDRVHLTLVHAHLPRLVDVGLVTTDTDGGATTVALTDQSILETEWIQSLLADPTGDAGPTDEATLNRTLEALRSPRRRTVCEVLARRRGTVSVADLAATVVAREADDGTRLVDVTESASATVETSLVHQHLPTLSAAGLVEYDAAAGEVVLSTDAPQWLADWVTDGPLAEVAEFVRRRPDQDGATDEPPVSKRPTDDATPSGEPTADVAPPETAPATVASTGSSATSDSRLLWTLAQPPADRSSSSRSVPNAPSLTEREEQ